MPNPTKSLWRWLPWRNRWYFFGTSDRLLLSLIVTSTVVSGSSVVVLGWSTCGSVTGVVVSSVVGPSVISVIGKLLLSTVLSVTVSTTFSTVFSATVSLSAISIMPWVAILLCGSVDYIVIVLSLKGISDSRQKNIIIHAEWQMR